MIPGVKELRNNRLLRAMSAGDRKLIAPLIQGVALREGSDRSANEAPAQSAGWALRLPATEFRHILQNSPTLAPMLMRYAHVFLTQSSQTALANVRGTLEERLARWLLMWHDRVRTANLKVTHELEGTGMIQVSRDGFYGVPEAEYDRLFGS